MYYSHIVDSLAEMGLSANNIYRYAGVKPAYTHDKRRYESITYHQLETCSTLALWNVPLIEILRKFHQYDPNKIYRYISQHVELFDASTLYAQYVRQLRQDGIALRYIMQLLREGGNAPSIATIKRMTQGIKNIPTEKCSNDNMIMLIKYVKLRAIFCDYSGYLHLSYVFPKLSKQNIAQGLTAAQTAKIYTCNICGKEFISPDGIKLLFCAKCRKRA